MALPIDPPRYILLETARHYAVDRLLAKGELDAARARMADTMLALLDQSYDAYWSVDEAIWLHRYSPELNNVRAAMDWALEHDRALSVALFGSAWPLFVEADLYAEGRTRYAVVLGALSDTLPRERVGRFWEAIATYDSTRQVDRARFAAELAAAKHAATSDRRANYYALMLLAYNWRVDFAAAQPSYEAARKLEDPAWPARLLTMGALTDGALLTSAGRFDAAREAYLRAIRYALTTSERQALAASVNVVELDIARGDTAAALQLGRPLALSLLHLGRRETRFDLLVLNFSALLLAGAVGEARAAGAELYELALRLDTSKLFTALDAMALLACMDGRFVEAARIAGCADAAHEAHGQARRRPAEERIQAAVAATLEQQLGAGWHASDRNKDKGQYLDEVMACSLALGRRP
jgi:tetratricopeptide (TPR) repeat protein